MRVKALKNLYVDHKFRKEGVVFELENPKDFSVRSMKKMGGKSKVDKPEMKEDEDSESVA